MSKEAANIYKRQIGMFESESASGNAQYNYLCDAIEKYNNRHQSHERDSTWDEKMGLGWSLSHDAMESDRK